MKRATIYLLLGLAILGLCVSPPAIADEGKEEAGGSMALSEISWLKDQAGNIAIIQKAGYQLIDHFVLPPEAWWDDYYFHIENKLSLLKIKYQTEPEPMEVIENEELEIELYRKYHDYYGYVFYIMQK